MDGCKIRRVALFVTQGRPFPTGPESSIAGQRKQDQPFEAPFGAQGKQGKREEAQSGVVEGKKQEKAPWSGAAHHRLFREPRKMGHPGKRHTGRKERPQDIVRR